MHKPFVALILGPLFLLPVAFFVPTMLMTAQPVLNGETTENDTELDMMHFTPSASCDDGIYYVCRRGIETIAYFGQSEVYYAVANTFLRVEFPGSTAVIPAGEEPMSSATNYIFGNDPSRWKTGLIDCAVLRYAGIYPGVDLVYRFLDGNLKYEFVVAPHTNPDLIRLRYCGADVIDVRRDSLTVRKGDSAITDCGLVAFQVGVKPVTIECDFHRDDMNTVSLILGQYDSSRSLIVDPTLLAYSSFIGSSEGESASAIAVEDGFVYIGGNTHSPGFPMVNPYNSTFGGWYDCFVTKLTRDCRSLIYSTFFGGVSEDGVYGLAVEDGSLYATGYTGSPDFPTLNASDSTYSGGLDCFVTKFAVDGQSLIYSTFLGGTGVEHGHDISVVGGIAYVTGNTGSSGFPTVNAYDATLDGIGDTFVTKFAVDGQSLIYSTLLGGEGYDIPAGIAVENSFMYVAGYTNSLLFPTVNAYDPTQNGFGYADCYVTKLATDGQSLVYSTYLGGGDFDNAYDIDVENGFAYVAGWTCSSDFPTANAYDPTYNGWYDCFVTKLAVNGQSLVYSTFLGGSTSDRIQDITVDNGSVYVTGYTGSTNFPTVNGYDSTHGGDEDCFVTRMAANGRSLVYSTFLGGPGDDVGGGIALENGTIYVAGGTESASFPTVSAYNSTYGGNWDCFVAVFSDDSDMDGLSDWSEALYGANPYCIDSDNDNFLDGYEIAYGSNATDPMSYPMIPQTWYDALYTNLDGNATLIQDLLERLSALNSTHNEDVDEIRAILESLGVTIGDTDYDGLDDLDEMAYGTDIQCIDTDCDNLNDAYEVKIGTDPTEEDSDKDAYLDGAEVMAGTNPLSALDNLGTRGLIIVAAGAGCVGLVALSVVMRRRRVAKTPPVSPKSSSAAKSKRSA